MRTPRGAARPNRRPGRNQRLSRNQRLGRNHAAPVTTAAPGGVIGHRILAAGVMRAAARPRPATACKGLHYQVTGNCAP
jgi:hypothetical protein